MMREVHVLSTTQMQIIIHSNLLSLFLALNVQVIFRGFSSQIFFSPTALFTSLLFLVMTTCAWLAKGGIMERAGFCNVLTRTCQMQRSKRMNKTLQRLLKKMNPILISLIKWFQSVSFTKLNPGPPYGIVKNKSAITPSNPLLFLLFL